MAAALNPRTPLHAFRPAVPAVTSKADLTTIAVLSMTAIAIWMLVLPVEVVFLSF